MEGGGAAGLRGEVVLKGPDLGLPWFGVFLRLGEGTSREGSTCLQSKTTGISSGGNSDM